MIKSLKSAGSPADFYVGNYDGRIEDVNAPGDKPTDEEVFAPHRMVLNLPRGSSGHFCIGRLLGSFLKH